jgi:hypothetical protein
MSEINPNNPSFLIYPAIDENYDFPPEVRQAIADSPELAAAFALYAGGPQTTIDGGGP